MLHSTPRPCSAPRTLGWGARRGASARLATGLLATVLLATMLLATAPAAWAADGQIDSIRLLPGGRLEIIMSATGLPPGARIDPASVTLSLDGRPAPARVAPVTRSITQTAILAIDTSGSMGRDGRLAAAQRAATAFLAATPRDVRVGLVTFADTARTIVAPTLDRGAVRRAVATLQASGGTALRDAAVSAVTAAGTSGVRQVLLLSDGEDTRSATAATAAAARIRGSRVRVDAVAFGEEQAQLPALRLLTSAGNGTLTTALDANALTASFRSRGQAIGTRITILATVPPGARRSVAAEISARAGSEPVSVSTVFTLAAVARPSPTAPPLSAFGPRPVPPAEGHPGAWALPLGVGALFLGLAALLGAAFTARVPAQATTRLERRLAGYTLSGPPATARPTEPTALGGSTVARSAVSLAGRMLARRGVEERLGRRLEAAGVPLKAPEWLIIHAGVAVSAAVLLFLLSGGGLLPAVLGLVIGAVAPQVYLDLRERRRVDAFLQALPDTLQLIAGSLQVGHSLPQAVEAVARESQPPVSTEFHRTLVENRLGIPIEDALDSTAQRMRSRDFAWAVTAVRIQREVGGNLPEILVTVAATLRERERLRRQVQVLAAEGRISAWILGLLPPVFFVYVLLVRRAYLQPLITDPLGWMLLLLAAVIMGVGVLWLRRVARVEV